MADHDQSQGQRERSNGVSIDAHAARRDGWIMSFIRRVEGRISNSSHQRIRDSGSRIEKQTLTVSEARRYLMRVLTDGERRALNYPGIHPDELWSAEAARMCAETRRRGSIEAELAYGRRTAAGIVELAWGTYPQSE
jgi:hypothetical protein